MQASPVDVWGIDWWHSKLRPTRLILGLVTPAHGDGRNLLNGSWRSNLVALGREPAEQEELFVRGGRRQQEAETVRVRRAGGREALTELGEQVAPRHLLCRAAAVAHERLAQAIVVVHSGRGETARSR